MPYRRLPNTDQARVRALRTVLEESDRQPLKLVVSYKAQHDVKLWLNKFEQAMGLYKQTYENQVLSNKDFQQVFRNARLYISHFIQVLNLAVQRGEIKKEYKKFYQLDPEDFTVPDMVSSESLIEWGKNVIDGEAQRLRKGGVPLYNPAIAKVKVHIDIFKEFRDNQLLSQQNTSRYADKVDDLRLPVDELLVDVWNQIEAFFADLPPFSRLESCKQYGVVYYYRKGEAVLTPDDDLVKAIDLEQEEVSVSPSHVVEASDVVVSSEEMVQVAAVADTADVLMESVVEVEGEISQQEVAVDVVPDSMSVKIELETIEESTPIEDDVLIVNQHQERQETTLFGEEMIAPSVDLEEPEVKLNGIIPSKKRKKRNASQDALLSLFFQ